MRARFRPAQISLHSEREGKPVRIVADAAIAGGPIGDGRLIPLVILDTTDRPDLEELIRVHQHLPPGDADSQWGKMEDSDRTVVLFLSFKRPVELVAILEFDIVEQGILVDQILTVKCLYIQSGREGDRFVKNPNAPRIYVEVPDTGFREVWDRIFHRHIMKHMRRSGLSRQQAKRAAGQFISELREFGAFRMGRR